MTIATGWVCWFIPSMLVVKVNFKPMASEVGHMDSGDLLTVSEIANRSGFAASAIRFYEKEGMITASRTAGGQRRFERQMLGASHSSAQPVTSG